MEPDLFHAIWYYIKRKDLSVMVRAIHHLRFVYQQRCKLALAINISIFKSILVANLKRCLYTQKIHNFYLEGTT